MWYCESTTDEMPECELFGMWALWLFAVFTIPEGQGPILPTWVSSSILVASRTFTASLWIKAEWPCYMTLGIFRFLHPSPLWIKHFAAVLPLSGCSQPSVLSHYFLFLYYLSLAKFYFSFASLTLHEQMHERMSMCIFIFTIVID